MHICKYLHTFSDVGVKAKDVDDLGKKCHLISKSIKLTDPDVCLKFDLALVLI